MYIAEMKENKNSGTTRLPEELKQELRKEQAPYLARGQEAPSFGSLLHAAWRISRVAELQDVAELLAAPDTTETLPLKSQLKVTLREYRKQHPKEEAGREGTHNKERKSGTR